jgi:hypothetical protein
MLPDWLFSRFSDYPTIGIWLIVAGILGCLLLLNLVLCCATTLWKRWNASRSLENTLLLAIHVVFGVTLICHGLALVWGEKTAGRLGEGESMVLSDGRTVSVEKLSFVSDPSLLSKSRHDRTRETYDWDKNYVLLRVDDELLPPLRHLFSHTDSAGYHYALPMFMDAARPMGAGHGHGESRSHSNDMRTNKNPGKDTLKAVTAFRPVAVIIATRHHVDTLFLVSFALVLGLTVWLLCLTWNKRLTP